MQAIPKKIYAIYTGTTGYRYRDNLRIRSYDVINVIV